MNIEEYELPIKNYKRLLFKDDSSKFDIFIKSENQENERDNQYQIQLTLNKARVLSKKINDIYQIDPTITTFTISISKEKFNYLELKENLKEITQLLIKLSEEKIKITNLQEQNKLFHILLFLLGEEDNIKIITSIEESLSYLSTNFHYQSIEYLSSHFYEFIESGKMKEIEEEIMKEIIDSYFSQLNEKTDKKTQIKEIIRIFNKMKEKDEESKIIIYFILNLNICEYNKDIQKYFINNLNDEILESEYSRIIFAIKNHFLKLIEIEQEKTRNEQAKNRIIDCKYSDDELSGIISYLSKNKTTEEVIKSEIQLTGGGIVNPSFPIINLIKYDSQHINDRYYNRISNKSVEKDAWIQFDFGEKRINLSSYTIRSNGVCPNIHAHPKSWKISGSNDGEHWEMINQQNDNPELNGVYKQHRFECEKNNNFYRYIQYKQDDTWDSNESFRFTIYICCIEFFGYILFPE